MWTGEAWVDNDREEGGNVGSWIVLFFFVCVGVVVVVHIAIICNVVCVVASIARHVVIIANLLTRPILQKITIRRRHGMRSGRIRMHWQG